jgi:hypothetical protein
MGGIMQPKNRRSIQNNINFWIIQYFKTKSALDGWSKTATITAKNVTAVKTFLESAK